MPAYVDQYLRLEDRARDAEGHAEQYRARAEENRWEQCRIAHDAVESGEFSRRSFAEAVGRSEKHIRCQFHIWNQWGATRASQRPSYGDAYNDMAGDSTEAKTSRRDLSGARQVLADPRLARQVLDDPDVRRKLMSDDRIRRDLTRTVHEVDAHRAARVSRQRRESAPRLAEAREYYDALARLTHARQDVNKALDLLRGLPPLQADQRDEMRQVAGWLSTSLDWLHETLKARRTATLSDEIENYLADQGTAS